MYVCMYVCALLPGGGGGGAKCKTKTTYQVLKRNCCMNEAKHRERDDGQELLCNEETPVY